MWQEREGSCLREGGTCGAEHSPLRGRSPGRGAGPLGAPRLAALGAAGGEGVLRVGAVHGAGGASAP